MRSPKENRRYHLRRKLRKQKVRFSSVFKTIFFSANEELDNATVLELQQNYNYTIQFIIPHE